MSTRLDTKCALQALKGEVGTVFNACGPVAENFASPRSPPQLARETAVMVTTRPREAASEQFVIHVLSCSRKLPRRFFKSFLKKTFPKRFLKRFLKSLRDVSWTFPERFLDVS